MNIKILINDNNNFKEKIMNLEDKIIFLNKELNYFNQLSFKFNNLFKKANELEQENTNLKNIIAKQNNDYTRITSEIELKYEYDINKLKSEVNLINHKYDFVKKHDKYVINLESVNEKLSNQIDKINTEYKINLKTENERYHIGLDKIRKQTLDMVAVSKKNAVKNANETLDNSSKLQLLQNIQMRHELVGNSKMIEDLLVETNQKNRIIKTLKFDLNLHKEVENVFAVKNKKMADIMKTFNETESGVKRPKNSSVENIFSRNSSEYLVGLPNATTSVPVANNLNSINMTQNSTGFRKSKKNNSTILDKFEKEIKSNNLTKFDILLK